MPAFTDLWQDSDAQLLAPYGEEGTQTSYCRFAQEFSLWGQELVREPVMNPSHVTINQARLTITRKYREWRNIVPKAHRNRIGETGHICIFHVWDECMRALEAAELTLAPPQLYLPEPVKKPRRVKEKEAPRPEPPSRYDSVLGEYVE